MNRQQGRRIKPLKQRRWKFHDEILDRFEDLEARRQAGHHSYQARMAGTPEYYAFQADSKFLQLTLLKLPFHAICGGVFNTECGHLGYHRTSVNGGNSASVACDPGADILGYFCSGRR